MRIHAARGRGDRRHQPRHRLGQHKSDGDDECRHVCESGALRRIPGAAGGRDRCSRRGIRIPPAAAACSAATAPVPAPAAVAIAAAVAATLAIADATTIAIAAVTIATLAIATLAIADADAAASIAAAAISAASHDTARIAKATSLTSWHSFERPHLAATSAAASTADAANTFSGAAAACTAVRAGPIPRASAASTAVPAGPIPRASAASTAVRPHHVTQAAAALLSIDCARAAPARLRRPRAAISSARLRFPCAAWGSTLPYDPSCTATGAHWLYDGGSFPTAHGTHGRFHGHGWWLRRITAAARGAHGGPSPAGSADQPAQPRRGLLAPLASSCADHHDGRARHRQPQPYRNVGACTSPLASERGRHERGKHVHTAGDHRSRGASTDRRGHRGNGGSRFSVC